MSDSANESPLIAVVEFSSILEKLGIPYLISGSFASSVHGDFRTTNDIDYLAKLIPSRVEEFIVELAPSFDSDDVAIRAAVQQQGSFNIFHEATFMKIDVFTKVDLFGKLQLERAQKVRVPGTESDVRIASPEDSIISKLLEYRLGNQTSDQQWRDILGVVRVQEGRLDREYLSDRGEEFEITELLVKALSGG